MRNGTEEEPLHPTVWETWHNTPRFVQQRAFIGVHSSMYRLFQRLHAQTRCLWFGYHSPHRSVAACYWVSSQICPKPRQLIIKDCLASTLCGQTPPPLTRCTDHLCAVLTGQHTPNFFGSKTGVYPLQLLGWAWNPNTEATAPSGRCLHPNRPPEVPESHPNPQLQGTPESGSSARIQRQS